MVRARRYHEQWLSQKSAARYPNPFLSLEPSIFLSLYWTTSPPTVKTDWLTHWMIICCSSSLQFSGTLGLKATQKHLQATHTWICSDIVIRKDAWFPLPVITFNWKFVSALTRGQLFSGCFFFSENCTSDYRWFTHFSSDFPSALFDYTHHSERRGGERQKAVALCLLGHFMQQNKMFHHTKLLHKMKLSGLETERKLPFE